MYDPINERVLNHKGTTSLQILKLLPVILINNTPHTQALVSAVLLRPHPQESDKSVLSSTSQIRVQVEQDPSRHTAYDSQTLGIDQTRRWIR